MRNFQYTLLVVFIAVLATSLTKLFKVSPDNICSEVISECRINPSYQVSFDNESCKIKFYSVWMGSDSCNDSFEFSNDGGLTWMSAKSGLDISQSGVSNCKIVVSPDPTHTLTFPLINSLICNCGPCLPSGVKQREKLLTVLKNPTQKFIPFDICCCEDYKFVFHNKSGGTETVNSILSSLRLNVDYLNGIEYRIEKIDDSLKTIHLLPLP
mgnify:CR=1 FL=1